MRPSATPRILMTTDAVGGVFVYASELAHALCDAGHHVTLVVMGPAPSTDQLDVLGRMPGPSVEVTDLALEWMDPEGRDTARAHEVLMQIAERVQPDIVHLNSYREACFDWPAPVLVVAHSCVISWWRACHGSAPDQECWSHYAEAVASGLNAADAWIAPTLAMRDAIASIYRPSAPGGVIWNGADLPSPASHHKQPFILAAGRVWDEAKNLADLAAIAPALDWPVRVAGPMQAPAAVDKQADVAAINYLGELPRAKLIETMQRAAIFVAPALYEPFGLTVLEAAASECALVLSDIPSFRELWNGAALFVDPRDHAALLAALQQLTRDQNARHRLQQAAAGRARRYSSSSKVHAYVDLYDRMQSPASATTARCLSGRLELHA